ncbi:hypothetical protein ACR78F_06485 [Sphingobacterium spiritivorum]|uniref:Outer membrane insertion signal domain protein n=2 Tax=Sphingobacterium spiritivorum TaxID=258 RepID=D7VRG2_SPHSI|nr:hypothetical protein [Sphingobacterium spiritivorum]EEI93347.1 hypothetical protein HMPREF0765_1020 [Sphingobacterium spiritivorum ATCC 33300]EFK56363.1 hypothetical protein HMPREF0766_13566 [Sphingobacterium spiritivorum ATCC 33861]QQS95924.1 hypothetical protein I6J03_21540 [Sphingobacterium spiritivorum]QQT35556.1 hypothetical protein I6J01_20155 [Sphingobacterium spiritivorum]WQD32253.1 hypothetical protein U0038_12105 [Sphingobacterium spiritivorum]
MRKILLSLTAAALCLSSVSAQEMGDRNSEIGKSIFKTKYSRTESNKGKIFVHWGYNFSSYAKSDITFKGPGYNFTLHDVKAGDRPTKLSMTYLDPGRLTIPQFNFHFGYFIKDNYSLSLGWDHMKYVVDIPQRVKISGFIDPEISSPGIPTGDKAGSYNGEMITVDSSMLTFEHTDGYNFAALGLERYDDIIVNRQGKQVLTMESGVEAGLLIPRSDVHLFGEGANHFWNIAGYGGAAKVGLQYRFYKGLYLQGSFKTGYTELTNIRTTGRRGVDKAQQGIWFFENYWVLGFRF